MEHSLDEFATDEFATPFTPEVEKELAPACKAISSGAKHDAVALLAGAIGALTLGPIAGATIAGLTKLGLAKMVASSADAVVAAEARRLDEHERAALVGRHVRKALHALQKGEAEKLRTLLAAWFEQHKHAAEDQFQRYTRELRGYDGPEQLERYYASARAAYRRATIDLWRESFPRTHHGSGVRAHAARLKLARTVPFMDAVAEAAAHADSRRPPFIATQGFLALDPQRGQIQYLRPEAFLAGRESNEEARASDGAKWLALRRVEIVQALSDARDAVVLGTTGIQLPRPQRLFLVTGGGVGKTTNMRWLEAALNCTGADDDAAPLAVLVEADALTGECEFKDIVAQLARAVARLTTSASDERWALEAIERGIESDLAAGQLAVLVDGLDHVAAERIAPFILELQHARWDECRVVMAGRPQSLKDWTENSPRKNAIDAGRWRFIQPDEFDDEEAKVYLDTPDEDSRYELVKAGLGGLAQVPRVLECARELTRTELETCRTAADIYWQAIKRLVKRTIIEGGEPTRDMDPERALQVLAALAFQTLCPTASKKQRFAATSKSVLDNAAKQQLTARIEHGGGSDKVDADLRRLGTFATIIGNGILSATETETGTPRTLVWSNRTVQEFLAALWLANYAGERDAARMRFHVFRPEDTNTDYYYEFNVFLAEMPADARSAEAWVLAASAWYEFDSDETRPTEMMFRSWPTMHAIAERALDDWWDCSYVRLIGGGRGSASVEPQHNNSEAAQAKAAALLDAYQQAFQQILDGERGDVARDVARELVDADAWCNVPDGTYEMGSDDADQGFPKKTEAYWNDVLDAVQSGKERADIKAAECTPSHWFAETAAEKRLQERDIEWLSQLLKPLEPGAPRVAGVDARKAAYDEIRNQYRSRDETPKERSQGVKAFSLHRYPVLHRWYRLWSPTHAQVVANCLDRILLTDASKQRIPIAHPPDDHPATYVSWYDAWAFCQWACWKDAEGKRFGLRLPHEVEWEYAARFAPEAGDQPAQPVPLRQPYWWGTDFYKTTDGKPERSVDRREEAHADGTPGATRAPGEPRSKPNGLGLHDMLGNVWEWMANIYDPRVDNSSGDGATMHYSRNFPEPERVPVNPKRAMRGGLWYYLDLLATVANRYRLNGENRDYKTGFRVVREERPARNHG